MSSAQPARPPAAKHHKDIASAHSARYESRMEGGVRRMRSLTASIRRELPREQMDASLPTPLYHQVYLVLRDKIVSGAYGADGLLPGEPALVQQFGVSRITVKRALNDLAAEGFVRRRRGLGTRVVSAGAGKPRAAHMAGLIENLIIMGVAADGRLTEFAYVLPPDDARRGLGLPRGARAQRAARVRSHAGVPVLDLPNPVPAPV